MNLLGNILVEKVGQVLVGFRVLFLVLLVVQVCPCRCPAVVHRVKGLEDTLGLDVGRQRLLKLLDVLCRFVLGGEHHDGVADGLGVRRVDHGGMHHRRRLEDVPLVARERRNLALP